MTAAQPAFARSIVAPVAFVAIMLIGGMAVGSVTRPDGWYAALIKPSFNPPNWLFGPVWAVLYVAIGYAGFRVWRAAPRSPATALWAVQLMLNFAWSPTFFAAHAIGGALVIVASLVVAVAAFIVAAWRVDRPAAWLFVPYACWVAFATLLNAAVYRLN